MATVNRCSFIGTLVRDVEIRVTPKGTAVGTFSLALNRKWKDESGGEREEVSFLEFEAFAKTAEIIAKYTAKGRQLYVEARAKQDTWEDKETQKKRSKIKFIVESFQFLGGKQDGESQERAAEQPQRTAAKPAGAWDGETVPF